MNLSCVPSLLESVGHCPPELLGCSGTELLGSSVSE